jgi:AIR synthase-related protein
VLSGLVEQLRQTAGILHKQDIRSVSTNLISTNLVSTNLISADSSFNSDVTPPIQVGDDCAAIPDGDTYLLFAAEGILPAFVDSDPWFAGWSAVMVNISDIAAMGGRALAVVDVVWSQSDEMATQLWAGMQAAAQTYDVPIVGGHTNHRSPYNALSVAITGRANRLISGFNAQPGDALLMAIDLNGQPHPRYPFWNAATKADPIQLRRKLEILPALAEAELCDAGKDISMGGIVGTLLMLLETSRCGAVLDLDTIPRPPEVALERWLISFPSYGFLLSVRPERVAAIQSQFQQQQIACEVIGQINSNQQLWFQQGNETALFWDLAAAPITGFAPLNPDLKP